MVRHFIIVASLCALAPAVGCHPASNVVHDPPEPAAPGRFEATGPVRAVTHFAVEASNDRIPIPDSLAPINWPSDPQPVEPLPFAQSEPASDENFWNISRLPPIESEELAGSSELNETRRLPTAPPAIGPRTAEPQTSEPQTSKQLPTEPKPVHPGELAHDALARPVSPSGEAIDLAALESARKLAVVPEEPASMNVQRPLTPREAAQLAAVGRQVSDMCDRASSLAARGAYFASRGEFLKALRRAAESLDVLQQTNEHSRALDAGLRAMKEAEEFSADGQESLPLSSIIAAHRTPVLKRVDAEQMTSLVALQKYLTFAQQQLADAVQGVPEGSQALYGLGRLQAKLADGSRGDSQAALTDPQAMVYHQAALRVDGRNYRAANELGVLLARYGQHGQSRQTLLHSLSIRRTYEAWHNLSVVHHQLGERPLAELARREADALRSGPAAPNVIAVPGAPLVEWVEPQQFARQGGAAAR